MYIYRVSNEAIVSIRGQSSDSVLNIGQEHVLLGVLTHNPGDSVLMPAMRVAQRSGSPLHLPGVIIQRSFLPDI